MRQLDVDICHQYGITWEHVCITRSTITISDVFLLNLSNIAGLQQLPQGDEGFLSHHYPYRISFNIMLLKQMLIHIS